MRESRGDIRERRKERERGKRKERSGTVREREEKRKVDREKRTSEKRDREKQRERKREMRLFFSSLLFPSLLYSTLFFIYMSSLLTLFCFPSSTYLLCYVIFFLQGLYFSSHASSRIWHRSRNGANGSEFQSSTNARS